MSNPPRENELPPPPESSSSHEPGIGRAMSSVAAQQSSASSKSHASVKSNADVSKTGETTVETTGETSEEQQEGAQTSASRSESKPFVPGSSEEAEGVPAVDLASASKEELAEVVEVASHASAELMASLTAAEKRQSFAVARPELESVTTLLLGSLGLLGSIEV